MGSARPDPLTPGRTPNRALPEAPIQRCRPLLTLATACAALVLDVHSSFAHAELARSDPPADAIVAAAPARLTLWFTEDLEPRFSEIRILDRAGRRVDDAFLQADPADRFSLRTGLRATDHGTYTVLWKALSAVDGHVTRGAFGFTVGLDQTPTALRLEGQTAAPVAADRIVVRAGSYLGMAGLLGVFPFLRWVLLPALAAGGASPTIRARTGRTAWGLALLAAAATLLAALADLVTQAAAAADAPLLTALGGPAVTLATTTRFGILWWERVALVLGLGALVAAGRRVGPTPTVTGLGCGLGLALVAVHALGSHAAATPGATGTAVALDWVHLTAAVLWAGGLVHLAGALATLRAAPGSGEAIRLAARLVPRFSVLGVCVVGALWLTGVYQAWLLVGSLAALTATPYGQALLLKLALCLPLLGLAAVNLLALRPRLLAAAGGAAPLAALLPPLRRTVAGEIGFVGAVLAVAGLLTSLQPGRDALAAQGLVVTAADEDVRVTLQLQPGTAGVNRFDVALTDRSGRPIADAQKVAVRLTMPGMDMGESELTAYSQGDGHYVAQGGSLVMAGAWRAELIVRRAGYDDVRPTAELAIRDATPSGGVESAPPPAEGRLILGMEFLLLAAVAFGYAIWMAPGESQVLRLILPAAVAAVLAGSLMVGSGASALRLGWSVRNPIPPTPDSLARGRLVYTERCVLCHGEDGRGDGPGVPALSPPPPDFRLHLGAGHTDGEWFDWVSNGVPGTAMPGYRAELSTDDRWHVLNYLQQRFGSSPGLAPGF